MNKRGITLIALIITVIILLILAGTAISIAINGGDIFNKAVNAKDEWNQKTAEEKQSIKDIMYYLNDMKSITIFGRADEITIHYEDGMTWREFAQSEYGTLFNVEQLGELGEYLIVKLNTNTYCVKSYDSNHNEVNISLDSAIEENETYIISKSVESLEGVEDIYPSQSKTYSELWDDPSFQEIKNHYNLSYRESGVITAYLGNYELTLRSTIYNVFLHDTCSNSHWLGL